MGGDPLANVGRFSSQNDTLQFDFCWNTTAKLDLGCNRDVLYLS